jgi:hypothetical protein
MSLISRFGKAEADKLRLENRRAYQDLIFTGLGFEFNGQTMFCRSRLEVLWRATSPSRPRQARMAHETMGVL